MDRGVVVLDGQVLQLGEARVPVTDRAFLYGDAVFEALRTYGGRPHEAGAHLARLFRSAALLGIDPGLSEAALGAELEVAIEALGGECYLRLVLSRGASESLGFSTRGTTRARRVIVARPLEVPPAAFYERGVRLESVTAPVSHFTAGAKPAAYLNNLMALTEAEGRGGHEALLLGASGELLEGATSSLFVVCAGRLLTPPVSLGILPGITRGSVLEQAARLGLDPAERLLTIHDAYRAEEVLITSSIREVVPVVAVDGVRVGDGAPGPVARQLLEAYRKAAWAPSAAGRHDAASGSEGPSQGSPST